MMTHERLRFMLVDDSEADRYLIRRAMEAVPDAQIEGGELHLAS